MRGRRYEPTFSALPQRAGAGDSGELLCRFGGTALDDDDEPDHGA